MRILCQPFFFELAQRHAVFLEELDEMLAGDAAVLAAGDAVAAEPAGIEPFTHRPRRDLADLRDLAGGKDFFHGRHSSICCLLSPHASRPVRASQLADPSAQFAGLRGPSGCGNDCRRPPARRHCPSSGPGRAVPPGAAKVLPSRFKPSPLLGNQQSDPPGRKPPELCGPPRLTHKSAGLPPKYEKKPTTWRASADWPSYAFLSPCPGCHRLADDNGRALRTVPVLVAQRSGRSSNRMVQDRPTAWSEHVGLVGCKKWGSIPCSDVIVRGQTRAF